MGSGIYIEPGRAGGRGLGGEDTRDAGDSSQNALVLKVGLPEMLGLLWRSLAAAADVGAERRIRRSRPRIAPKGVS